MENNLTTAALDALRMGLSVIPCKANKRPALEAWKPYQAAPMAEADALRHFPGAAFLGLVCGKVSGRLEVLDVDLKYDTTGTLWDELQEAIDTNLPGLLDRLVITETMSAGRHLLFRCEVNEGNLKLAQRPANDEELAQGDKVLVLLETRGEGGYVIAPPSPGYTFLKGDLSTIPTITKEERETLLGIARSFDLMPIQEPTRPSQSARPTSAPGAYAETPLDHYKREGDVLELLQRHGWTVLPSRGDRVPLRRPGKEGRGETSGNWHKGLRKLYVFSTSTEFDTGRAHSASDVFVQLEAGGDHRRAFELLKAEGWGTAEERSAAQVFDRLDHHQEERREPSHGLRILSDREIDQELRTMPARKSTGWRSWDRHVKLRPAALTLVGATPGAGKSLVLLNMALNMAETYPDEVFVFVSAEMPASEVRLRLQTAASYRGDHRRERLLDGRQGCYLTTEGDAAHLYFTDGPAVLLATGRTRTAADGEFLASDAELLEAIQRQALQRDKSADEVIAELVAKHYAAPRLNTATPTLFVDGLRKVAELRAAGRLVVVDAPDETVPTDGLDTLLATIQEKAKEKGLTMGGVFVDYAGLVESKQANARDEFRVRTIQACNDLKRIAKQYTLPVVVAAQLNIRESDLKSAGSFKHEAPTSHFEAIGKPLVPAGDKFAETSQFYRAADLVLYLANPMQEAGGSDAELVAPYLTHGELPLFVKVAKMRGGAPGKFLTLGYVPHAQALHETFDEPPPHLVRICSEAERLAFDKMPAASKPARRGAAPTEARDTKLLKEPRAELTKQERQGRTSGEIPEHLTTRF